jgi:hypothetical protein
MSEALDAFHAHEALDRLHVVLVMIDEILVDHPYIAARPEIGKHLALAESALGAAYQAVAREHMP